MEKWLSVRLGEVVGVFGYGLELDEQRNGIDTDFRRGNSR